MFRNLRFNLLKMKYLIVISAAMVALVSCSDGQQANLTKAEVEAFVTSHMESQVGYEDAVEPYKTGLSEETKYFRAGQAGPKNADLTGVEGTWFYEDSVRVDIMDVQLYGSAASVMGVVHFYNFDEIGDRSFHGTVVRDGGRLRWDRWFHQDHGKLARSFVPIESEVEGAKSLCNTMLWATLQGDGSAAGSMSDSLVKMDPTLAIAHVGAMWRAWFNSDAEAWNANIAAGVEKANDPATRHYLMSHSKEYGDRVENARIAHNLASDSPLTQVNLAWLLMGEDDEAARILLERCADRWSSLGGPHNLLGYMNMRQGDMEAAETSFSMYVRLAPDVANAHDSMGDFYAKKGDNDRARSCYEKAIELDPSFTSSQEKIDELGS